ncbi:MAG: GNAT family N-acetyltransferase [bacterium]|nr:GNAT family N-acetyltransferase [bacterium]
MTVRVRPIAPADVAPVARLLAARHATERRAEPLLPAGPADDGRARALVEATLAWRGAVGRVAEIDGVVAGLLVVAPALAGPGRPPATFVAATAHAATDSAALAALLAAWDDAGERHVQVGVHDAAGNAAVAAVGFEPLLDVGVARLPLALGDRAPGLAIRQAGAEDLEAVLGLAAMLRAEHASLGVPDAGAERARQRVRLADLRTGVWLALVDGVALGMVVLQPPGTVVSPLHAPADAIHVPDLVVAPAARGRGVAAALLAEALGWAGAIGYRHVTLHVHAGNVAAARFWRARGVRVVARQWRRDQCPR